jgi:hypothetical protein
MDRIKDCGRIAKGIVCIDVPCGEMAWDGERMVDTGKIHPPHLWVANGRMGGEDGDEEEGDEWVLPPEWQALLVLQ